MLSYSSQFYDSQARGSAMSAEVVVPLVLSLFPARSVIDIGCGVGGWLNAFERHGVSDYVGVDGDYVSREQLRIAPDRFIARDLTTFIESGRTFDLACSLEVAEHLPVECADQFVAALVQAAPVVLFSAAIPGQGGTAHVNEQWQSYWAELFFRHDYIAVDCIRPQIYYDERVEFWYRQNILVFCSSDHCPSGYSAVTNKYDLDRIHPGLLALVLSGPQSGQTAANAVRRDLKVLGKAVLRKVGLTASAIDTREQVNTT